MEEAKGPEGPSPRNSECKDPELSTRKKPRPAGAAGAPRVQAGEGEQALGVTLGVMGEQPRLFKNHVDSLILENTSPNLKNLLKHISTMPLSCLKITNRNNVFLSSNSRSVFKLPIAHKDGISFMLKKIKIQISSVHCD